MEDILGSARAALQPFIQVTNLTDLYNAYKTIPTQYTLIGHCLCLAALAPEFKHRFLVHFWMTFLAGFGGGVVTSILIMDPMKAPISIFANNALGLTWLICWWLMTYSPFDVVSRLHSLPPIKTVTKLCVTFMRANLIINRVDLAVALFPGVIAAPLILGTLAGSGGKLLVDAIRHHWGGLSGPTEASVPTFVWRSAALAAGGYWAACKYTGLLTSQEAAAVVITVLLVHSLLSDLFGPDFTDFTYPVAKVAHALSLVPMPTATATPKAAKKAASQQQPNKPTKSQPESITANGTQKAVQPPQQNGSASALQPKAGASGAAAARNAASGKNVAVKADSSSAKNGKKQENKKTK
ncbi:hypothetical protein VOLCADRAFT_104093 [Volvox carteri f. nagariensis]|uniref:Uncharacterized protein n=1 Tax=Volvox carteri f. nagariensis TaxID=3068 RepID=D8TR79_VOLCA|nr:uncharacterized protein VOLCADRAFT_104093 [Volvox carteri f. nagariensis]EFJ49844.1 hypothetical protein VOLCADRAFT_104093 [Volvox carteri f. nagariensis]|eukprot:XP_002948909.1 hypothetical protein VOLCADRAFT_104093 [Volvox carteri f. nagariensis]